VPFLIASVLFAVAVLPALGLLSRYWWGRRVGKAERSFGLALATGVALVFVFFAPEFGGSSLDVDMARTALFLDLTVALATAGALLCKRLRELNHNKDHQG